MKKYLIFDFNGTIIDDVDLGITCMNRQIQKYLKRPLLNREEYLDIFTFPVIDYYKKIGFDFSKLSFAQIGADWAEDYYRNRHSCKLQPGVVELLNKNHLAGNYNIVLSASYKDVLIEQLKELNVYEYIDEIYGMDNIYGHGKSDIALKLIEGKNKGDCLMLGDTLHDYMVAKEMGIDCILVARGHQNKETLLQAACRVVDSLEEVEICE